MSSSSCQLTTFSILFGFMKAEPKEVNMEDIDKKYRGIVVENMPLYEKLREHKLNPM